MLHFAIDFETLKNEFKKKVVIGETAILVTILADRVYAIQDKCPHMGASLVDGYYKDGVVECKKHGAQFNVENGKVVRNAKLGFIKLPTKESKTFKTVIKDGKVFIDM